MVDTERMIGELATKEVGEWRRLARGTSLLALALAFAALLVEILVVAVGSSADDVTIRNALITAIVFAAGLAT